MSKLSEKINEMVKDHDIELLSRVMNELLGRFENLNGCDGIMVEYVKDEIIDVINDYMNYVAK